MDKTVNGIAQLVGGMVGGDGSCIVHRLAALDEAEAGDLAFAVPPHIDEARSASAAALLLPTGTEGFSCPHIFVDDPKAAFACLLTIFTPAIEHAVGVSDEAYIGADVRIGTGVTVLPFAYVDDHAVLGDGVTIYPHAYVGQYSEIGDHTVLYPNAVVREHCRIGARCTIHSSAVIGADGFGFTTEAGVHTKVPQVGGVVVEDDVEIGAHVGIDRATLGSTVIGKGTKIDNASGQTALSSPRRASPVRQRLGIMLPSAGRLGQSDISRSGQTLSMLHARASSAICLREYSAQAFLYSPIPSGCVCRPPCVGCLRW